MTVVSQSVSAARKVGKRAGLTLLELIVVLFILAAVAGIALSAFPSFQKLTHGSSSANSIRTVETSISATLLNRGVLGTGFDSLLTTTNAVPDYVGNGVSFGPSGGLPAGPTAALAALGITTLTYADNGTAGSLTALLASETNATLDAFDVVPTPIGQVAELTSGDPTFGIEQVVAKFNITGTAPDRIFMFGLGSRSSLTGLNSSFKEAPVHTPGEGSAATTYGRYGILIGYEGSDTDGEAFYIGTVCIDDGQNLNNISNNLGEYYEAGQ